MNAAYFIGGPTRAGKTTVARKLTANLPNATLIPSDFALFGSRHLFIEDPYQILKSLDYSGSAGYKRRSDKKIVTDDFKQKFNDELSLTRRFLEGGFDYFARNKLDFIVEGHSVSPSWLTELNLPDHTIKAVFLGWLHSGHIQNITAHRNQNEHDWMNEWLSQFNPEEQTHKTQQFVDNQIKANQKLKDEAEAAGFTFVDVSVGNYTDNVNIAVSALLDK